MKQLELLTKKFDITLPVMRETQQEQVFCKAMLWLLIDPTNGVINFTPDNTKLVTEAVHLYQLWLNGKKPDKKTWHRVITTTQIAASALHNYESDSGDALSALSLIVESATAPQSVSAVPSFACDANNLNTKLSYKQFDSLLAQVLQNSISPTEPIQSLDL